jgi:hypothetical protein
MRSEMESMSNPTTVVIERDYATPKLQKIAEGVMQQILEQTLPAITDRINAHYAAQIEDLRQRYVQWCYDEVCAAEKSIAEQVWKIAWEEGFNAGRQAAQEQA